MPSTLPATVKLAYPTKMPPLPAAYTEPALTVRDLIHPASWSTPMIQTPSLRCGRSSRCTRHSTGVTVSVLCPAFFRTNLLESWQGNARMKGFADKMMASSPDTLESVSDAVFAAVERGQFLVIPTAKEPMRWRMKRWFPEFYFRQLVKFARGRGAGN